MNPRSCARIATTRPGYDVIQQTPDCGAQRYGTWSLGVAFDIKRPVFLLCTKPLWYDVLRGLQLLFFLSRMYDTGSWAEVEGGFVWYAVVVSGMTFSFRFRAKTSYDTAVGCQPTAVSFFSIKLGHNSEFNHFFSNEKMYFVYIYEYEYWNWLSFYHVYVRIISCHTIRTYDTSLHCYCCISISSATRCSHSSLFYIILQQYHDMYQRMYSSPSTRGPTAEHDQPTRGDLVYASKMHSRHSSRSFLLDGIRLDKNVLVCLTFGVCAVRTKKLGCRQIRWKLYISGVWHLVYSSTSCLVFVVQYSTSKFQKESKRTFPQRNNGKCPRYCCCSGIS